MKFLFTICFFFLMLGLSVQGFAQKEIEIDGVKYIQHTVAKSETVFSLCQKYKVTQKDILQANPGLSGVLQAGSIIKIPVGKVVPAPKVVQETKPETKAVSQDEEEYYYHKVGKRQTIFSVSQQYGITANDLIRYNPELTKGLVVGQVLKIPVSIADVGGEEIPTVDSPSSEASVGDYTVHPVVSGETLFSLEQRYGVSHEEMLKNNPALQNGLKAGMKLKIPVKAPAASLPKVSAAEKISSEINPSGEQAVSSPEEVSGNCQPLLQKTTRKFTVGLLLPFYLKNIGQEGLQKTQILSKLIIPSQASVSLTDTSALLPGVNIDPKAESFIEFYEGALLAVDSLQRLGMKIELLVFDVNNQAMINALLQLDEFRELDLIIGPVHPELQESVASFAAKNRIPMISPLASNGTFEQNNSWYFKVSPTKEYLIEKSAAYATTEFSDKNFILLQQSGSDNSQEALLAKLTKEKLGGPGKRNFREYNFQQNGVNSIKPLLDETGENIFVIPTDNEAKVSVAVTNLCALAENYNIVLMGTSVLTKLKSIQTENFHKIRLRYLSPYFVDYSKPLVKRFVATYRDSFSAEPTQFSFQGFDVSYYFLSALFRYGKDFRKCLPDYPMELTQNSFLFHQAAPMGGMMNGGLFITAFERNYDVLNYGIVGGVQADNNR